MAYETTDKSAELKKCYKNLWDESAKSYYCKIDSKEYDPTLKELLNAEKKIYEKFIDEIFQDYDNIYKPYYSSYYFKFLSIMKSNFGKTIMENVYYKFSDYFDHKKKLDSYISEQNKLENDYRILTLVIKKLKEEDATAFDNKIMFDEKEIKELQNSIIILSKGKKKWGQDQILNFQKQLSVVENETINSFLSKRILGFKSESLINSSHYKETIVKELNDYKNYYLNPKKNEILSEIISCEKEVIEKKKSFECDTDDIIEKMKHGDYIFKKQLEKLDGKKKSLRKKKKSKKKSKKKKKY
jgi:hypothetical protein